MQIVPRAGSPDATSDSPYIAYECLVWNRRFAVLSNGSHTRPIFERLASGATPRDAMVAVLAGLDREFDEHDTPRICGMIDLSDDTLWLGSVTATALAVMPVTVAPGQMAYVTTYGFPLPSAAQTDAGFTAASADAACRHVIYGSVFAAFDKPICAAAAMPTKEDTAVATLNVSG